MDEKNRRMEKDHSMSEEVLEYVAVICDISADEETRLGCQNGDGKND